MRQFGAHCCAWESVWGFLRQRSGCARPGALSFLPESRAGSVTAVLGGQMIEREWGGLTAVFLPADEGTAACTPSFYVVLGLVFCLLDTQNILPVFARRRCCTSWDMRRRLRVWAEAFDVCGCTRQAP